MSVNAADAYDGLILHPVLRRYFGPRGFYNVGLWDEPEPPTQEEACEALLRRIASLANPERVVDVGCGLGATTRALAALWPHADVTGVNYSIRQLREAPGSMGRRALCADATALPLRAASCDCVVSIEAAFHFDPRTAFFDEAARLLVGGGTLLLTDALFRAGGHPGAWTVPAANAAWSLERYADALAAAGFDDIDIEDVTTSTWMPFARALQRWISESAGLDETAAQQWIAMAKRLESETVEHYLIARARRRR